MILNRVLGADPSSILGTMSANGKVFLVNPNGILFGKGASVNVGGLVASTLNITDSDFMAGNYKFSGASQGSVQNLGSISAAGGYVALLGANVSNDGIISAQLGTVALAAGNAITLDVAGDGLLNVTVNQGALNALVQNGGLIQADGGQVMLTAQAAGTLMSSAVNNTGVIQAQTLVSRNGTIKLLGDMQIGTVNVGGKLDASAPNGGDGGFIETSAARVKVADRVNITTHAALGKTGTWLIDPQDFIIGTGGDILGTTLEGQLVTNSIVISTVTTGVNTPPTNYYGVTNGAGDITVNDALTWTASGAPTTLTLNAARDVNFNAAITATKGSLVATAGNDVVVKAGVTNITVTNGNITWNAGQDIQVNGGMATGVTATFGDVGTGNIAWIAGRDVNIGSTVTATGGNFTVCCGRDIKVNAATTTTDGDAILNAGRDIVISAAMTTTRGNVLLRAGSEVSAAVPSLIGGTVVFSGGSYTVTGAVGTPVSVTVDYTPSAYNTPTNYAPNFTLTDAIPTSHMLVFAQGNNKVYDGNTNAILSLRSDPTVGGTKAVSLVSGTGTFDDKNVAPNIGITYNGYSLDGTDVSQFALWGVCGSVAGSGRTSAAITSAPLTITANNNTKVYGTTFTPAGTAFTTIGLQNSETVGSVTELSPAGSPTTAAAPGPYAITPSAATGGTFAPGNYTINYVNGALTVTPAPLTVTANNNTKVYGQTFTPVGTAFTTSALQNGETVGSVTETSPAGTPTTAAAPGPYAITPSAATGGTFAPGNYTISYVNGALTVTPAPLNVTANNNTKVYGQTFTPAGTAFTTSALQNGETVGSVTETSPAGTPTTAAAPGPYAITPSAATGGTFAPGNYTISYVNGALTVTPAPLTVTANDSTKTFGQIPALTGFTTTPLANGETIGSVTETSPGSVATASVAGGPYAITPSGATGGTFTPSNYTIAYNDGILTVAPAVPPPILTPPIVTPPIVLPPVESSPVVVPPATPVTWAPMVTPPTTPPELLTLVPPSPVTTPPTTPPEELTPVPPSPVLVFVPTPIVTPVTPSPALYVAPVHLRKQDRN